MKHLKKNHKNIKIGILVPKLSYLYQTQSTRPIVLNLELYTKSHICQSSQLKSEQNKI